MTRSAAFGFLVSTSLVLAACGGGGSSTGGTSSPPPPPPLSGTVSGTAVKGPVTGATVTAYAISSGTMGAKIASAAPTRKATSACRWAVTPGSVMLQMSGGTYTDEASGNSMAMMSGDVMTAVLPTMAAGATVSGIQMTPLTSMAQTMAQHLSGGMTDANIAHGEHGSRNVTSWSPTSCTTSR